MKRCVVLSVMMIFLSILAHSQKKWIDTKAGPVESIEKIVLPILDNQKLKDKYHFSLTDSDRLPNIFAEAINTDISTANHGTWESTEAGHLLWRQRIVSKGAYTINLGFTKFNLPPSAALFLSNTERSYVIGPITQKENDLHNEWWSPVLKGDDIIVELQIDPSEIADLKLELTKVNHDFSGLGAAILGPCDIDVICGENDGFDIIDRYRDMIQSVGAMLVQGRFQCTGWLVNNTKQDCTPYVMTAEHCGITESTAASVIMYWNYQNSQCRAPNTPGSGGSGDGSQAQFNSGSRLVAQFDQTDFSLVELDDPVDPSSNPYFNGWDRITEVVDSAFTVHHPGGLEKRISFDYDQLTFNVDRNFVRVSDWDLGTTEGGSSGAPLYTKEGLVVGFLSGGDAACSNDLEDDFGMFKIAWEGGGSPETRLKDWLDPINSGVSSLVGRYCTDVAVLTDEMISLCTSSPTTEVFLTARTGYADSGTLSIEEISSGLNVSFSAPTISTDETVSINIELTEDFQGDTGQITLRVENDLGPSVFNIEVLVYRDHPAAVTPLLPAFGATGLDFDIDFRWSETAPSYQLEISQSESFIGDVRIVEGLTESSVELRDFESSTTYFWRVKGINACGESPYSLVSNFTTGSIVCQDDEPSDLPQSISFDPDTVISTINVSASGVLADVNVKDIKGTHTWIRDLTFTLTSPSGTKVVLVETPCDDEDNFFASFDDDSDNINLDCPLTTGRTFQPVEELAQFIGEEAAGVWTLTVIDGVGDDGGVVEDWTLELCINKSNVKGLSLNPGIIELCDKDLQSLDFSLSLNGDWTNPQSLTVTTGSGIAIGASYSPNPIGSAEDVNISIGDPSPLVGQNTLTVSVLDEGVEIKSDVVVLHTSNVSEPLLQSPTNTEDKISLTPKLEWTSGAPQNNDLHRVTLALNEDLTEVIAEIEVQGDTLRVSENLEELTTYFWQVTALGACTDLTSEVFSFMTDQKVATINERFQDVHLYPSPVNDYLTVDLGDVSFNGEIIMEVISLSGKVLVQKPLNQDITQLRVSDLPSGLYLINFVTRDGIFTSKIVVDR